MENVNEFARFLAQEVLRQKTKAVAAAKAAAGSSAAGTASEATAQAAKNTTQAAAASGEKAAPTAYYSPDSFGAELRDREAEVRRSRLRMELAVPKLTMKQKSMEQAYATAESARERYYQTRGQFQSENAALFEKRLLDEWTNAAKAYQEAVNAYQAEYDTYKPREDSYNSSIKDYNEYAAAQQEAYQQWRGTIRGIDEIRAEQAQYRDAEAELERLMKEQNKLAVSAGLDRTVAAPGVYDANRVAQNQERIRQLQEYMGSGGEKGRLLQEELEWAEYYKYDDVRTAADFEEKSAYRSTANGSRTRIDPLTGTVYGSHFNDPLYDYVNRNGAAVMEQGHNNRLNDMSYVEAMNDDEIGIFNYLYATEGSQRARDYLSEIQTRLTARQMGQTQSLVSDMATQNGFLGALAASAISVGLSPVSGFQSTLGQLGSALTGREIDPNASYNLATNTKNAIRQAVSGKVEENFGPVGSFFYDTGMSMLDMLMDRHVASGLTGNQGVLKLADGTEQAVNLATDGARIKAAVEAGATLNAYASPTVMTIMSSRAFSESVIDAKNRGMSDGQALTMGLTSALAEVVTERVGLDELGKLPNEDAARSLLGRIWKGAVGEGLEEGMTSIINLAADQIITGKDSEFWQNVRAFQDEGYTDSGAFVKAMGIAAGQVGIDMLGGMVSGGIFGAADRSGTEGRKKTDPAKSDLSPTNAADKGVTRALGEERLTLEKAREIAISRVNPLVTGVAHTAESRAKLERIEKAETLAEVTGIDLGVDEERIQSAARLSRLLGKDIVFYSAAATKSGVEYGHYQRRADQIAVNAQSPQVIAATIGHELTHSVESAASYERLRDLVKGRLKGTELDAMRQSIRALYEKNGVKLSDEELDREVLAKYVEQHLLTDEESIRQMVEDDRNVAQRILDWLDALWNKLRKSDASQEREFVRQARYLYRTALEEARGKRQRMAAGELEADDWLAPLDDDAGEYSFGGVNARAADRQALEEAKKMAEAGISAKTIFRKTGWYQGADGKWRFEIDDSKIRYDKTGNLRGAESGKELLKDVVPARKALEQAADDETMEKVRAYDVALIVKNEAKQKALYEELSAGEFGKAFQRYAAAKNAVFDSAKNDFGGRLADYIDHPALFEQYPKLQDMWLIFRDLSEEGAEGYFDGVNLVLDESLRDAPESTMLHEIQHAIQKAEGFAGGSNPEYWAAVQGGDQALMKSSDGTKLARKRAMRALMDLPGAIARSDQVAAAEELGIAVHTAKKFADGTDARRDPFELYDNTAGEIEARDVSRRRNMSAEQRKKRLPDTGDGNTVFAEDGAGRSYSIGPDMTDAERYQQLQHVVLPVAEVDYDAISDVDLSEYNTRKKSAVIPGFKRLAQQLGIVNVDLRNSEISFPFRFSNRNLEKSLHHQLEYGGTYQDYVKAMSCFNEIVSNAALIEVHRDKKTGTAKENRDLLRTYVLLGAYRDDGKIVPVQLEVKEFRERGDSLYMNVVLTKIEPEVVDAGIPGSSGDVPHLVSSSMISLRHLLTNVKAADGRFLKYVPDQFLNEAQLAAKDDALRRQKEEYQGYGEKRYSIGTVSDDDVELAAMIDADEEPEAAVRTAIPEGGADPEKLKGQALDEYRRCQRRLAAAVAKALDVPRYAQKDELMPLAERLAGEYLREGTISQESRDELFETGWELGRHVETEFYDTYKHVKDFLRNTAVTISEADRWRDFAEFRRQAIGTLKIVNEGGTPVDSLWEELRHMAPELFPEDVYNVEDQLKRMLEVAESIQKTEQKLDDYYGEAAAEMKYYSHLDFEAAVTDAETALWKVRRLAAERQAEELAVTAPEDADGESPEQMTVQEVMELWPKVKDARRNAEKVMAKHLLTKADKEKVRRLMAHDIQPEHLDPRTDNVEGIMAVYKAKWLFEQAAEPIRKWNRQRKARDYAQAEQIISDAGEITDKKIGLGYSVQTMERSIRDIVKNPEAAEKIIQTYFAPVHTAQAKANGMMKEYRERVRGLELSRKVKKGNQVSESYAVQFYGEVSDIMKVLEEAENATKHPNPARLAKRSRDGKTYAEWQAELDALWENNPGLNPERIEAAAAEFGKIYEELFQQMNEARVANGYEPINHRSGYFPHFQKDGRDGILSQFGRALGIEVEVQPLPTTINGLTHTFKPGIRWFGHALERKGFQTAYDAVEGFDRYIEGAADVVHQTGNIQRLRALANQLRYRTGDEGLREQIRKIQARTDLNDEEKDAMIRAKWENGRYELSNFVVELDEYTNLLANKKSRADRNMEQALGRNAYNVVKAMEGRVAANMVAINPASWLTNFIPLTQGWACLDTKHLLSGMWQTLRANKTGDGIADASAFLTNRQGSERLVQTWSQRWSAKLSRPMEWIDGFTSGSLVRARYRQNLSRGMSEAQAMADADEWTAGVIADRSKGAMPTLFYRSNPVTKLFTQFQLEVANQYGYLLKDIPRQKREEHIKNLAWALLKFALGAWIYNNLYESFLGRRPALDPIELLLDTGEGLIDAFDPEKDTDLYDVGSDLIGDVLEQTPFIGGLLGGGRVPISSALPDAENLGKALFSDDWDAEKRWQTGWKEIAKPGLYILPPFGGGQIKKIWEALAMVKDGGSYTLDKDGNPQLQYPLYSTNDAIQQALELGQAIIFGKTTIRSGRDWVNGGFGNLSADQTAAYLALLELDVEQAEAFELLTQLRRAEKTDEESRSQVQRTILSLWGLDGEATAVVYYDVLATEKDRALMDTLRLSGADMGEVTGAIMDMKDADAWYNGASASNAKRDAIMVAGLTDAQKATLYREMISSSWDDDIQAFKEVGLDMDEFLAAQSVHASIKEQYEDEGDMATAFARWCNRQGYTDAQKQIVRESLKYWQMMPAQADRYDRAISEGLSDAEAYKLAEGLDALEPPEDKTQVQDVQKWRVAIDQAPEMEDQLQWLRSAGLSGTTYEKVETGWEMGLPPAAWVRAKEVASQYDANGNGSLNQAEIKALIDGITTFSVVPEEGKYHLSQQQKAVLWQMLVGKNTKATNNPYSASEGQRWRESMGYE